MSVRSRLQRADEAFTNLRANLDKIRWPLLESWSGICTFTAFVFLVLTISLSAFAISAPGSDKAYGPLLLALATSCWGTFNAAALMRLRRVCAASDSRAPLKQAMRETLTLLLIALGALTLVAVLSNSPEGFKAFGIAHKFEGQIWWFGEALCGAFFPAAAAAYMTEQRLQTGIEKKPLWRSDTIAPGAVVFGAFAAAAVVGLGWAAGSKAFEAIKDDFGLIAMLFVMVGFLVFIVISSVTRGWNTISEAPDPTLQAAGMGRLDLAAWLSRIDSALVHVVAPMTGATQAADGRHGLGWHHMRILLIMSLLTWLGYAAPQPFGLLPIALAFLFALAVGRRWSWVEADRETASRLKTTRSPEIRIGFGNDFRDEALLCYLFLFLLVPLMLFQINEQTNAFCYSIDSKVCAASGKGTIGNWISFFGLELMKAIPLVDWAEIYDFNPPNQIIDRESGDPTDKHLLFAARVLVDLVVMAALFQAFAIFQRGRTQRQLYDAGQLDFFDPILEEEFFEHGMRRINEQEARALESDPSKDLVIEFRETGERKFFVAKPAFERKIEAHVRAKDSEGRGLPVPYDLERLAELLMDSRDDLKAGARWMIRKYGLVLGDFRTKLDQLNANWAAISFDALSERERNTQRLLFEQLLIEAQDDPSVLTDAQAGLLVEMAVKMKGQKSFERCIETIIRILSQRRTKKTVCLLGLFAMNDGQRLESAELKLGFESVLGTPLPPVQQGRVEPRILVYQALEAIGSDIESATQETRRAAFLIVDLMSVKDAAKKGQDHARKAAELIKASESVAP